MINIKNIVAVMCFFTVTTITAQKSDDRRENFEFGVKAGVNLSNVWDSEGEDFSADPKGGFAGGLFFGIPLGGLLGIQPEILISQKGFKGSGSLLGFPYSFSRTTTYLDVPLQAQFKPAPFLTILAGPQFSYLMNQKDSYTFGNTNSIEQEQEFENDNVRKNILGFVVGTDFIYKSLVLSARGGWDFQTNNGDGTSATPRYKNQWLQISVGFKI